MKTKDIKLIDLSDWDDLVKKTYGRIYNFQQQDDCKARGIEEFSVPAEYPFDYENDSIPVKVNGREMGVSFQAWLDKDPSDKFFNDDFSDDLFWSRNFYPGLEMVVNDLYNKGLIEAGNYAIDIDW